MPQPVCAGVRADRRDLAQRAISLDHPRVYATLTWPARDWMLTRDRARFMRARLVVMQLRVVGARVCKRQRA